MTLEQGMIVVITSLASALIIIWKRLSDSYDKMEKRYDSLEQKIHDCEGDKRALWKAILKLQGLTCTKGNCTERVPVPQGFITHPNEQ